jgi:ribosomal protein S18 acetylase RimI-like enzyme
MSAPQAQEQQQQHSHHVGYQVVAKRKPKWRSLLQMLHLEERIFGSHKYMLEDYLNEKDCWWYYRLDLLLAEPGCVPPEVIGYALVDVRDLVLRNVLYLDSMGIVAEWRNAGYGRQLLNAVLEHTTKYAPGAVLFLKADSELVAKFYERQGFTRVPSQDSPMPEGLRQQIAAYPAIMSQDKPLMYKIL